MHEVCTPPRDLSKATEAVEKIPVVVSMAGRTIAVTEQTEDMTEGSHVDSGHYKERGRSSDRRPHQAPYLIHYWRMEVHDMVLMKIPMPEEDSVPKPPVTKQGKL